jgi:hypothetical protein
MKNTFAHFLSILLMLYAMVHILSGCSGRNRQKCEAFRDLSDSIKAYAPYQEGNYWVYQLQSDTTIKDTLTCIGRFDFENDLDDDNSYGGADACTKLYEGILEHSNHSKFKLGWDTTKMGREEIKVYSGHWEMMRISRNIFPNNSGGDFFWYPNYIGTTPDPEYGYKIVKNDTNLTIGQQQYEKVSLSIFPNDEVKQKFGNYLDSIYLVSGIGIIQYKDDDDVWQLIDYNIQ